ncbi:MAG: hypothetical protein JNL81_15505 [Hyphomonadaceae bacterium]|nr:hypothetical protein [Hyphomonadaceae bacterium]
MSADLAALRLSSAREANLGIELVHIPVIATHAATETRLQLECIEVAEAGIVGKIDLSDVA